MARAADPVIANTTAERAVLGACLLDPDAVMRCRDMALTAADFAHPAHATIYAAIEAEAQGGGGVDVITVADRLATRGQLDAIGGRVELLTLVSECVSTATVRDYAAIVQRAAGQRAILDAAGDVARLAHDHQGDLASLYDAALSRFLRAVDIETGDSHLRGDAEALIAYLAQQEAARETLARNPDALIEVGWADLGHILGDLVPGFIHVVAAESSVGKTMYMEHVTEHNARRGHHVVFYHAELSHRYMLHRLICRYAGGQGVDMYKLRRGYNGPEVAQALDKVSPWLGRVTYVHCPGWSAERVAMDMRRLYAQGRLDVAVIDYLQKLALPDLRGMNAAMLIGQQAEVLKNAAEKLEVPVVLGSQVSRSARNDHRRPTEADIRNSGEVAERSNQVVVLHRPRSRDDGLGKTELIEAYVDKNTSGATGQAQLVHVVGRYLLADALRTEHEPPPPPPRQMRWPDGTEEIERS